jgi:polyisoprenoid-binding protein YceI
MAESVRYRISPEQSTITLVGETSLHPITVNVTPRLNAKRYPTITGVVTEVVEVSGPTATVKGDVTFLGQDVELEGDVSIIDHNDDSLSLAGSGQMDVQWWGLEPPTLLVLKMEPIVTVSIDLVLEPVDRL